MRGTGLTDRHSATDNLAVDGVLDLTTVIQNGAEQSEESKAAGRATTSFLSGSVKFLEELGMTYERRTHPSYRHSRHTRDSTLADRLILSFCRSSCSRRTSVLTYAHGKHYTCRSGTEAHVAPGDRPAHLDGRRLSAPCSVMFHSCSV